MMQDTGDRSQEDNFRDAFKYYKRKQPPPDLTTVLEVHGMKEVTHMMALTYMTGKDEESTEAVGLMPLSTWRVYGLENQPGFLIIRNPFTINGQRKWIKSCVKDYPNAANPNNLSSHGIKLSDHTWWELCQTTEGRKSGLSRKLRWVTLGYHHNWDSKEYSEDMRGPIPHPLAELCGVVARAVRFPDFRAEAAIINFYHLDSTLAPHTDHSEPCVTAPLLSFSFGQSAVFLLGGPTKSTRPSAVYLHSGDVVVMSGPSRLSYHAIPRVMPGRGQPWREMRDEGGREAQLVGRDEGCREVEIGRQREMDRQVGTDRLEEGEREEKIDKQREQDKEERGRMNEIGKEGEMERQEEKERMNDIGREREMERKEERCRIIEIGRQGELGRKIKRENKPGANQSINVSDKKDDRYKKTGDHINLDHSENTNQYNESYDEDILEYIKSSRININVRQVLYSAVDKLPR